MPTSKLDLLEQVSGYLNYSYTIGTFLNSVAIPATTTYYSCPFKPTADATTHQLSWPEGGTLSDMTLRIGSTHPASGSGTLVATLQVNGVDSALTITVESGSGSGSYSDTTHTVALAARDLLRWKFVNNASGNAGVLVGVTMKLSKQTT